MYKGHRIGVVIPALNEEAAIGLVVEGLLTLEYCGRKVIDEIVVCDNGSSDKTAECAGRAGARVVSQLRPGYGAACLAAMAKLSPADIVLFVDGDDSCFAQQAMTLLEGIAGGDDLAIGSRTLGQVEKGALTATQIFGNWLSSQLITLAWGQKITDLGPFRAIRSDALHSLHMKDLTFGWTVEMQVKAIICGRQVSEYPVDSKVRIGQSKISGTLSGSIKAGIGILSMIGKLFLTQRKIVRQGRLKQGRLKQGRKCFE